MGIPLEKAQKVLDIYNFESRVCPDCVVKPVCVEICELYENDFTKQLKEKYPIYEREEYNGVPERILKRKF